MVTLSPHSEEDMGTIPVEDDMGTAKCSLLHVIGAHTLSKVGKRAFLCGVCMLSPSSLGLHRSPSPKTYNNPCL